MVKSYAHDYLEVFQNPSEDNSLESSTKYKLIVEYTMKNLFCQYRGLYVILLTNIIYNFIMPLQSSYSFKGLETAHAMGMSWKSILIFIFVIVTFVGLASFLMFKNAQKNTNSINQNIEKSIQEANAAAEKQRVEMEANIQRQIDANLKK